MQRWLKKKVEKMIIDFQNKEISCQKKLIEDENMRLKKFKIQIIPVFSS